MLLEPDSKLRTTIKMREPRSCSCWALVVGIVLFTAFVGLGIPLLGMLAEGYAPVPGDARRFDPIANLAQIKAHAGEGAVFTDLYARYVRSDGTVELGATYEPYVTYSFYRELATPPPDAPPLGAGGGAEWYLPVNVLLRTPEMGFLGMRRSEQPAVSEQPDEPAPDPTCSFATLWGVALERDAPASAVAVITYDVNGYAFWIEDTDIRLNFTLDCTLER